MKPLPPLRTPGQSREAEELLHARHTADGAAHLGRCVMREFATHGRDTNQENADDAEATASLENAS